MTSKALAELLPSIAHLAERYITIHRVHPYKTYNYAARGYTNLPVLEITRHARKCRIGDSWIYVAVPKGSNLFQLQPDQKLYVGAQTGDRIFRGDGMGGDNFHHAEMRKGNGAKNLISFLESGKSVEIFRFDGHRMQNAIRGHAGLAHLLAMTQLPLPARKHMAWWFEQYLLHTEGTEWLWNTDGADRVVAKALA